MRFDPTVITNNWTLFAQGIGVSLLVAATALVFAFLIAVPLALMGLSRHLSLRLIAAVYLECFRNLPFIVVVYIFFYGLPLLDIRLPEIAIGTFALCCFASSYLSEIVRAAILSVPPGQMDAARAVGMSYFRGMWEIVAPQTLRVLLPPTTSTSISMLKETSILSVVTVPELTYKGLIVQGNTFAPFEVFFATAVIYWFVTAWFARGMRHIERISDKQRKASLRRESLADQYIKIDV